MKLYDEAIEEAIWHGEIEGDNTVRVILKALERAKKEHELLGLYRERKEVQNYRGEHPEEYYEVDDKIEVLEEEMK